MSLDHGELNVPLAKRRCRVGATWEMTVETPYSWTDRIPVGDVLEFRS